ncbi:DUF1801 domain-containing protein [Microbulbifer taiwanensis]|uniref:DUF1801 domain-containing protein n=1 Tax=Microbulbifer taiwanensis TaxID=986746 RepID=A0ABW1YNP0_9GAMM|nr:DUF1801 domain-containing protein [Microbulbifer taiwanensis]
MSTSAKTPDDYIEQLQGWTRDCALLLRKQVKAAAKMEESIKWGHLVFMSNGPVLLIRAEKERVLFGFWRGKRLREIEPGLKASGKYEMATLEIRSEPYPSSKTIRSLVREAVRLNGELGNPQDAARK